MKANKKNLYYTNRRYSFPKESMIVERSFSEVFYPEFCKKLVIKFFEENKRCQACVVVFENENEIAYWKNYLEDVKFGFMPTEAREEIKSWDVVNKSPYSFSFYNSKNIDWNSKEEGSLRISDHWNFSSPKEEEKHCRLNTTNEYLQGTWILAEYHNGTYHEIKRFSK